MMITRERLIELMKLGLINPNESVHNAANLILAELSTAELPVQGEAVASPELLETMKPRKLDNTLDDYWLAVTGEGPLAAEWKDKPHRLVYDLIAALLFTTPTLKPSVNELVAALTEYVAKDESYIESYQDAEGVGAIPNEESEFFKRYNRAQKALASHQSA